MPNERTGDANNPLEQVTRRARAGDAHALEDLARRSAAGDGDALTTLVGLGLQEQAAGARECLMTFARGYLINAARRHRRSQSDDPESMAQNGILELLKKTPTLQKYTAAVFLGYLDRMAHNWACDEDRRRKMRRQTSLGGSSSNHGKPALPSPESRPTTIEPGKLERLCPDPQEQLVMRKRFEEGLQYDEIARQLTPPSTPDAIRMQIQRILKRLGNDPRAR